MSPWLVLVFATTAYGLSRISQPAYQAVNFAKAIERRKLNGSVIKEIDVESEGACRLECVNVARCRSYNFGIVNGKADRFKCQLMDSDRFACSGNFTEDHNFKYRGTQSGRFRPSSCLDYLQRGVTENGNYTIYDNSGNCFPAYCELKSEPATAWTLVMSWSTKNRLIPAFNNTPLQFNAPENENAPNWDRYRLSLERMRSLQAHSTHWRATCSYPTHGIDFRDFFRGNFKDFNIVDFLGHGQCERVEYVDIRGHNGTNLTAPFWQANNVFMLHTDSEADHCEFNATVGAVFSEDNFGVYNVINPKFRCAQTDNSTTQWWFGAHLKK